MKNKQILLLFIAAFIMNNCTIFNPKSSSSNMDLTGTNWAYEDEDDAYEIRFKKDGLLTSTNPNDDTKGNDEWEQEGNVVKFYFNKRFSAYTGTINGNKIIGTAENQKEKTWEFKMIRLN